jgi:hypothetical protein
MHVVALSGIAATAAALVWVMLHFILR